MAIATTYDNFTKEKRNQYVRETTQSLEALLNDIFLGEDQNQIRQEFPNECSIGDIELVQTRVSFNYYNDDQTPRIEVRLEVAYKDQPLAEYNSIYNQEGSLIDELFYFE